MTQGPVIRRSLLYPRHAAMGASFETRCGAEFVSSYSNADDERAAAPNLGLCDLSTAWRRGVAGSGAESWLEARAYLVPSMPNRSEIQKTGDTLARLSAQEFLLLEHGALLSEPVDPPPPWADGDGVYTLPRQDSHCCFAVSGRLAAIMFSKLCAIDLRPSSFSNGAITQTSVAKVSAIVIRNDLQTVPAFYVLAGSTAAEYFWDTIVEAMIEFDGRMIGLQSLLPVRQK